MAKFLIGKEKSIKQSHTTQTEEPEKAVLDVVSRVRKALPQIAATLPQELQIKPLFDQSVFVSSALDGVMREGNHRGESVVADTGKSTQRSRLAVDPFVV